ncbi:MAG TPA: helix-turn-helix transcriptional regulator [Streptosporangiaceae bacterium]|jgi:transcriptional regulator with XRE-family HTH domain
MSDDAYGATVAKRRLSRRLAEIRKANGHTANQICDMLDWGRGKAGRMEANQWKRPEMSDIRDLLRLYNVSPGDQEDLLDLATQARVKPWWRDYSDIFENEFPGFENDAIRIRVFLPLVLPGLLQTPDYTEAFLRSGVRPPAWRRKAVESRQRRQRILTRADGTAPQLIAVITEASLHYRWGTPLDRREQLEHLITMSRRSNVELHVQRFSDGPCAGLISPVNIFDLPDDEPTVAYAETDFAMEEVTNPDRVKAYARAFAQACDSALEPGDSTTYLSQMAEQLE